MEHLDQQILLLLNGSQSTFLDNCFLLITRTSTWIPLFLVLLFIVFRALSKLQVSRNRACVLGILFIIACALVIVICDQTASTICKPLFSRPRPSHEPALLGLVDLVNGRRGGAYGFFSSHAANTFGLATFVALTFRNRIISFTLYIWAILSSYSRIYLGLHYPGDILVGLLFGILVGYIIYLLFSRVIKVNKELRNNNVTLRTALHASSPSLPYYLPITFLLTLLFIAITAI